MLPLRQRPFERQLYRVTKVVIAQQVSGTGGLSDCVERVGLQHIVE